MATKIVTAPTLQDLLAPCIVQANKLGMDGSKIVAVKANPLMMPGTRDSTSMWQCVLTYEPPVREKLKRTESSLAKESCQAVEVQP